MKDKKHKILIVDRNPVVREGLGHFFVQVEHIEVVKVIDDIKLLYGLLDTIDVDTVIMDIYFARTNLYRVVKDFIVRFSRIKFIVFTNYCIPKLVEDLMEFGINAMVHKSSKLDNLVSVIERVHDEERFIDHSIVDAQLESVSHKFNEEDKDDDVYMDDFTKSAILTEREMDVVLLISRGFSNKEMAEKLFLSKYTIETHRKNIMRKLKMRSSAQLILFASNQGLV